MTLQHKNKSAIGYQTNGIYIKRLKVKYVYIKNSYGYKHSVKSCAKCLSQLFKLKFSIKLTFF